MIKFQDFKQGSTPQQLIVQTIKSSKVNKGESVASEIIGALVPKGTKNAIKISAFSDSKYILPEWVSVKSASGTKVKSYVDGELARVVSTNPVNGRVLEDYSHLAKRHVGEAGLRRDAKTYLIQSGKSKAQIIQTVPSQVPSGTFDKALKSMINPNNKAESYNIYKNGYYERVSSHESGKLLTVFKAPANVNIEKYITRFHIEPKEADAYNIFKSPVVIENYQVDRAGNRIAM